MSFLNQLKSQAQSLNTEKAQTREEIEANTLQTEMACKTAWTYISELAKHLNVLVPPGPVFALDKGAAWPAMKLHNFRADSRKKMLRDREVYDTMSMAWAITPLVGTPTLASIDVDFVHALERVEKNLSAGGVKFERKDIVVQQDKKSRKVIRFEYTTQANGFITITTNHDHGKLKFRLANTSGFGVTNITWASDRIQPALMDEMAKMIVSQPHQFVPIGLV